MRRIMVDAGTDLDGKHLVAHGKKYFSDFDHIKANVIKCVQKVTNKFRSNANMQSVILALDNGEREEHFLLIKFDAPLSQDAAQDLVDEIDAVIPSLD